MAGETEINLIQGRLVAGAQSNHKAVWIAGQLKQEHDCIVAVCQVGRVHNLQLLGCFQFHFGKDGHDFTDRTLQTDKDVTGIMKEEEV